MRGIKCMNLPSLDIYHINSKLTINDDRFPIFAECGIVHPTPIHLLLCETHIFPDKIYRKVRNLRGTRISAERKPKYNQHGIIETKRPAIDMVIDFCSRNAPSSARYNHFTATSNFCHIIPVTRRYYLSPRKATANNQKREKRNFPHKSPQDFFP